MNKFICKKCGKASTDELVNDMCYECYSISKTHNRNLDFPYVINDKLTIYVDRSDYEKFISGEKSIEEVFHYLTIDELNIIKNTQKS